MAILTFTLCNSHSTIIQRRNKQKSHVNHNYHIPQAAFRIRKAEGVGFEPTRAFWTLLVFKTSAFNRSAIPPRRRDYTALLVSESGADDKLFHTAMAVTGMKKALAY